MCGGGRAVGEIGISRAWLLMAAHDFVHELSPSVHMCCGLHAACEGNPAMTWPRELHALRQAATLEYASIYAKVALLDAMMEERSDAKETWEFQQWLILAVTQAMWLVPLVTRLGPIKLSRVFPPWACQWLTQIMKVCGSFTVPQGDGTTTTLQDMWRKVIKFVSKKKELNLAYLRAGALPSSTQKPSDHWRDAKDKVRARGEWLGEVQWRALLAVDRGGAIIAPKKPIHTLILPTCFNGSSTVL